MPKAEETRIKNEITGGEKGQKPIRIGLIPHRPLWKVGEVYGRGAEKYADRNWELGYYWSLSYDALQRHITSFWMGEETDPESGLPHLAHAVWHCFTLMQFSEHFPELDDRSKLDKAGVENDQ